MLRILRCFPRPGSVRSGVNMRTGAFDTVLQTWLIAWLLGIAGVAGLLAGSWTISTYRLLVRGGAPAPGKVLRKLMLTPVAWLLPTGGPGHGPGLVGRRAWVSWDLRWGPFGRSSAIVQGCDEHHPRLLLLTPVKMPSGPRTELVDATVVRFTASRQPNYSWGTASGVLEPLGLRSEDVDPQLYPRARVCVV